MFIKRELIQKKLTLLLGGPGSGKGEMSKHLPIKVLSMGKILRERSMGSPDPILKKQLDAGILLDDEQIIPLLRPYFKVNEPLLLDGFPRTLSQWRYLKMHFGLPSAVIYLSASAQTMQNNGLERGRSDDTLLTITKRICDFEKQTLPMIQEIIKQSPHHIMLDANTHSPEELADLAKDFLDAHGVLSKEIAPTYQI